MDNHLPFKKLKGAMLIHLNENYHTRVKDEDVWIVKNHKSIKDDNVVEWKLL